jgi:hypothetical protein
MNSHKNKKGGEIKMKKSWKAYVGAAKYLKKEDISEPVDKELLWVKEEEVTAPGKDTATRIVAYFEGLSKGLVLNTENGLALAEITGTDDPNQWKDVMVQLYVDPDVKYANKKVGGIRLRVPEPVAVPVQEPVPVRLLKRKQPVPA